MRRQLITCISMFLICTSMNAGKCGRSTIEKLDDGSYMVTDCWCKTECQTWSTSNAAAVAWWCGSAALNECS